MILNYNYCLNKFKCLQIFIRAPEDNSIKNRSFEYNGGSYLTSHSIKIKNAYSYN